MKYKLALIPFLMIFLSSCGTSSPGLYSWYNYEDASYQNMKKQTPKSSDELMESYDKVINNQKGTRNSTPPGMLAEKGYALVKKGKVDEGLSLLRKEVELYPESEVFIGRIIKQLEE